jgi:hypothetical protein
MFLIGCYNISIKRNTEGKEMKMTETYAERFQNADTKNLAGFTRLIRFYDAITNKNLSRLGVSQKEIKEELEAGLIKYEPNLGISRRETGYSLTAAGVKKIYNMLKGR